MPIVGFRAGRGKRRQEIAAAGRPRTGSILPINPGPFVKSVGPGDIGRILPDLRQSGTMVAIIRASGRILPEGVAMDETPQDPLRATLVSLGAAIRAARRDAGITQATLAELAGTSERTIRDIERGSPSPSVGSVVAAARAVGLTVGAG
ncbi:hypothetical protein SCMU_37810 [Sinomonas cyclohexanicum]|uniref:HTH cro/C1-type domain-containing protein n=2 Tax=Sinomonas cyclohexanicum TaxID=322009 RepID=A0ABM7Q048_SINCY|nr:hypothetical protein SCMU_37810 [Corynebacterium cyclohexanicum]